jgi:hypothetical protein
MQMRSISPINLVSMDIAIVFHYISLFVFRLMRKMTTFIAINRHFRASHLLSQLLIGNLSLFLIHIIY